MPRLAYVGTGQSFRRPVKPTMSKRGRRRAGFIPKYVKDPLQREFQKIVGKNVSPERVKTFMDQVIDRAAGGKSVWASKMLKLAAEPLSIKVADGILKIATAPPGGAIQKPGSTCPILSNDSIGTISGINGLYSAKEHRVTFISGAPHRRWMKQMVRENGIYTKKILDTSELYDIDDDARESLVQVVGAGRKFQRLIEVNKFGFDLSDLSSTLPFSSFSSAVQRDQTAYAGISSLISEATVTNLNKFIPAKLKIRLLRAKLPNLTATGIFNECVNTALTAQTPSAMPYLSQMTVLENNLVLGPGVTVDPLSRGVMAADSFDALLEVVETRSVKLSAGDRLKIKYIHKCPSGLRLDTVLGQWNFPSFSRSAPITYFLLVESVGEEVDVHSLDETANSKNIIKATSPHSIQFEFKKTLKAVHPNVTFDSYLNPGDNKGFITQGCAIKVYSKSINVTTTGRRWNADYSDLNTTYSVPVMSDANTVLAKQIQNDAS